MAFIGSHRVSLDFGKRYESLESIYDAPGFGKQVLGAPGRCRFCGAHQTFNETAHSVPEFLGNRSIISLDECDNCNTKFSKYESALAEWMKPYLSLGGVKGKNKKVPQTGRSSGPVTIKHISGENPGLHIDARGIPPDGFISFDFLKSQLAWSIPVPKMSMIPRHAFKALTKMGVALMPQEELANFKNLLKWLIDPDDTEEFFCLEVVMSFADIHKPLPLVHGNLLKRNRGDVDIPYMVFVFVAGAICFQITLMSDNMDDAVPLRLMDQFTIHYSAKIGTEFSNPPVVIHYIDHESHNWASNELTQFSDRSLNFVAQLAKHQNNTRSKGQIGNSLRRSGLLSSGSMLGLSVKA